jgi:hypothetical protein
MRFQVRLLIAAFCLSMLPLTARPAPQAEGKKTENSASKKKDEKTTEKAAIITIHVLVKADNLNELPDGSSVEIKPDSDKCNEMDSMDRGIHSGRATFEDIPVCNVRLMIFVTGFDAQGISVDLSKCKEPITIKIDSNSPPMVSCSES